MKSSPRVKSGHQYRAVRSAPVAPDHNFARPYPEVFRKHPGPGHRHVLLVRHVRAFLEILPQWPTLSIGLNAILLAPARPGCDGFHRPGLVAICAQPRNLCQLVSNTLYVRRHADILARLGVPVEPTPDGHLLHFTEDTLRAYQLLHILLHELGHHHDRMTTRSKKKSSRGESFAELYARTNADFIWSRYFTLFPPAHAPALTISPTVVSPADRTGRRRLRRCARCVWVVVNKRIVRGAWFCGRD